LPTSFSELADDSAEVAGSIGRRPAPEVPLVTRRPQSSANRPSHRDDSTRPQSRPAANGIPYPGAPEPGGLSARLRRSAKTSKVAVRGRELPPIPPTVWTAGPDPIDPSQTWPVPIVEIITTSFSAPGARVLLAPWPVPAADARRADGDSGLSAACDAVRALGRDAGVAKLVLAERSLGDVSAAEHVMVRASADLIISSLLPDGGDESSAEDFAIVAARALAFGGILAVYTHCDWSDGELTDPSGPVIAAAQNADLLYLQHVVAVHTPIRNGRSKRQAETIGLVRDDSDRRVRQPGLPPVHVRAHGDILVFAQAQAQAQAQAHAGAAESEDLR
jgi:hypothetical protein